jgi:outer membrane lipoprotein SlyB
MNQLTQSISSLRKRALVTMTLLALVGMAPMAAQAKSNGGTVISTHTYQQKAAHGSGVGGATGAVVGGLLGNQIGHGNGKALATVAGAVGGGFAGNEIEKRTNKTTMTDVRVRMDSGAVRTFTEAGPSRRHEGQHVRVVNGHLN